MITNYADIIEIATAIAFAILAYTFAILAKPKKFKALMFEKTRLFCGRDFVFNAIQDFFKTQAKGYFTVIGDAGMGKSAIAAKYVLATRYPCYFNVFAEGRNKPEKFLASIRKQLIKICSLQNADNTATIFTFRIKSSRNQL
ncbi:MAG: hypothetical protein V7K32_25390 [Nostoc sp.]|uniref:hypothetical protein n=1 Tax=Nostoc sp. TaxID=1180 RepID=UPI002FFBEBE0